MYSVATKAYNFSVFNSLSRVRIKMQGNEKIFVCVNNCGRTYRSRGGLTNHLKYDCGKDPQYECKICGRKFRQKGNFLTHEISVHSRIPDRR